MGSRDPFVERVEAGMRRRDLTLRGLCRLAGLDPSFFSKVLAGKRRPPSDESPLRRIAAALEIDAAELIVSAGRIPSEWRALWDDPELFREVHARVAGAAGRGAREGVAEVPPAPAERKSLRPARRERFSEELL
jgi:transcriptional regulator with XRE-family HTH domain